MKPGTMTSEFWVTLVSIVVLAILGGLDKLSPELIAAVAGPAGIYALSRGIAKNGNGG